MDRKIYQYKDLIEPVDSTRAAPLHDDLSRKFSLVTDFNLLIEIQIIPHNQLLQILLKYKISMALGIWQNLTLLM